MSVLNPITEMHCETCGEEIFPGEGKWLDETLYCKSHYEEALEALASSYLSEQLRYERINPDQGLITLYILSEEWING